MLNKLAVKFEAAAPIARLHYVKMNSNICITTDTYEFIWSNVHQTYTMERVIVLRPSVDGSSAF
ncbi:hypothetical protein T03_11494 [Trichinella britovi]|uniref:Uncharacterized protein n=1 Tax=Trichinella britovi TaxID=45882 RepID=A0A0V1C3Y3_TRIBR|nr:hypothetical protein T03_11494 [Trichinella britovi]